LKDSRHAYNLMVKLGKMVTYFATGMSVNKK